MRKKLNVFVDPTTQKSLNLRIDKIRNGYIISGKLYNGNSEYPIIDGIPRFVNAAFYKEILDDSKEKQTSKSFGTKWRETRNQRIGSTKQDIKDWKEQFMAVLGCRNRAQLNSLFKKAKRTLNAGCGVAWPEYLFNYNSQTERHCIDISLAVEVGYRKTKKFKNVIVSQASIFELPYRDETFDIIYSLGVIHHTPNPKKAFQILVEKLVPGGLIGIYVYAKKPFLREIADREIRKITTKMNYRDCMEFSKKMAKLGRALNKTKQSLVIDEDIKFLGIKKGKYNIHKFIYNYFLKCWYNPKQDINYADLINQDWYHPGYASHHTKEEIINWFRESGMRKTKCIQPKGWEYSGYFISGRKT